jgi:stress-induced-phosphoprotein 1
LEESEKGVAVLQEHTPNEYQLYSKLLTKQGVALQKLKRFDEAIAILNKALLEHRNAETLSKLDGCIKDKKKTEEEAYLSVDLSIKAKEEGNAFFKKDNFPEAVKCYTEAIKRNPKEPHFVQQPCSSVSEAVCLR